MVDMKKCLFVFIPLGLIAAGVLVPQTSGSSPAQVKAARVPEIATAAQAETPAPTDPPAAPGQFQDNNSAVYGVPPVSDVSDVPNCASDPANLHVYASSPPAPAGFCSWLDYASMPHDTTVPPAPYASWQELMDHPPVLSFVPSGRPFNMNDPSTYPGA